MTVRGRTVRLCARCAGVYPGVLVGLLLFTAGFARGSWPWVVLVLPAPALVDWTATTGERGSGTNLVRTATGGSLGVAYGVALPWFLTGTDWLVGVAVGYGSLAAFGLWRRRRE